MEREVARMGRMAETRKQRIFKRVFGSIREVVEKHWNNFQQRKTRNEDFLDRKDFEQPISSLLRMAIST